MPRSERFIIRRLAFTGPKAETACIDFVDGVNVIWGASNAGKSFIVKALDFMCGAGSELPEIDEIEGYDRAWLDLRLPVSGPVTLTRATKGGGFGLFTSPVEPGTEKKPDSTLSADHKAKSGNLSTFLLSELGIHDKWIAKNQNGEKASFTFRLIAPYIFTEETDMMGDWSPIRISTHSGDTFDKNVLKFIVSGIDDSSVIPTRSTKVQKNINSGKVELIDEMISVAELEWQRKYPGNPDLSDQDEKIEHSLGDLQKTLTERQETLDRLRRERREIMDSLEDAQERRTEIAITLDRFKILDEVYENDVQRLASLEEGGAALLAGARRSCPLCGADPQHQRHAHGFDEVERAQKAARAEIAKIRLERSDLMKATKSLGAEQDGLARRAERLTAEIEALDLKIREARPLEASSRQAYEKLDLERTGIRYGLSLCQRLQDLKQRKAELAAFKPKSTPRGAIGVGVSGGMGHELAIAIQSVLHAWQFPGLPTVSFDHKTHDIRINGKNRKANGKGVRALMNAAFKIGLLLYCRERKLPHPGIIVLDSPLLSYRDPHQSRHGDLSEDEKVIKKSGLKENFYQFLVENSVDTQFIIIENDKPTFDSGPAAMVARFVGAEGTGGRHGFFPLKKGLPPTQPVS